MERAQVFTGDGITAYAMITLRSAIRLYSKAGIKVNSAYTPSRMQRMAENWTGKKFERADWEGMIEALSIKIESLIG